MSDDLPKELVLGGIIFSAIAAGAHFRVTVRGHGLPGQRPLLGTLAMTANEWRELFEVAKRDSARFGDRSADIAP